MPQPRSQEIVELLFVDNIITNLHQKKAIKTIDETTDFLTGLIVTEMVLGDILTHQE